MNCLMAPLSLRAITVQPLNQKKMPGNLASVYDVQFIHLNVNAVRRTVSRGT